MALGVVVLASGKKRKKKKKKQQEIGCYSIPGNIYFTKYVVPEMVTNK